VSTKRVVRRRNPVAVTADANAKKQKRAALKTMTSALVMRSKLASGFSQSFDGERDLYTALGYPSALTYKHFWQRYRRQDICKRIVEAYPDATWRGYPDVYDADAPEESSFTTQWGRLARDLKVYHYFNRVDVLAGVGSYAVLLIGFRETAPVDMSRPPNNPSEVIYLSPYSEENAQIDSYDNDPTSPRYGLPERYKLTMAIEGTHAPSGSRTQLVHWTRCIHVAEGLLEDEIFGTPRLEAVFNRIEDLARVVGGSAEMFWKGAFPGYGFIAKDGATWDDQTIEDFTDEVEEYFHGLKRFLRMSDTEIHDFAMQVANPKNHFDVLLTLVAGTTGIPQRILTGSERGELASNQDEDNWDNRVEERRIDFAEPTIIRPFVDRLGGFGILDVPENYIVDWPDLQSLSERDQADIGLVRAKTVAEYVRSGGESLLPPLEFLTRVMNVPAEEAPGILEQAYALLVEEEVSSIEGGESNSEEEG